MCRQRAIRQSETCEMAIILFGEGRIFCPFGTQLLWCELRGGTGMLGPSLVAFAELGGGPNGGEDG